MKTAEAIEAAHEAADPTWLKATEKALDAILAKPGAEFTTGDIWDALTKQGVKMPREPRALGGVMRQAQRDGKIVAAGSRMGKRPSGSTGHTTLWRVSGGPEVVKAVASYATDPVVFAAKVEETKAQAPHDTGPALSADVASDPERLLRLVRCELKDASDGLKVGDKKAIAAHARGLIRAARALEHYALTDPAVWDGPTLDRSGHVGTYPTKRLIRSSVCSHTTEELR